MNGTDLEFEHGQRHGHEHKGDRQRESLGVGLEMILHPREKEAEQRTQNQRADHLNDGIDHHGDHVYHATFHGLGHAERNGEYDKAHRVIKCNDGQQNIGQRTLGLVLLDDHERGGRCRRGCDRTEDNGYRHGQHVLAEDKVQSDQCSVDHDSRDKCLKSTDDQCLLTDLFQIFQFEFRTDGKGDKAERHLGNDGKLLNTCRRAHHAQNVKAFG